MFDKRPTIRALLASSDVADINAARKALKSGEFKFEVDTELDRDALMRRLEKERYDVVLLDAGLLEHSACSLDEVVGLVGEEATTIVLCHAGRPDFLTEAQDLKGITLMSAESLHGVGLAEKIVESIEAGLESRGGHIDARLLPSINGTDTLLAPGSEAVYRVIIENLQEGILTVSPEGDILFTNERAGEILNCDADSLLGLDLWRLVSLDDRAVLTARMDEAIHGASARCELPLALPGGETAHVLLSLKRIGDIGGTIGISVAMTDISFEVELRSQLQEMAITDSLTRLFNRRCLDDMLKREWRRAVRYGRELSCLMIDIDDFKLVNDTYGHLVGDEVLRQVASRIVSSVRETDIVTRFGGEEFAVLLPETSLDGAIELGDRVLTMVNNQTFWVEVRTMRIAVSIGAGAADPDTDDGPTSLLAYADTALSKAKAEGKNRVCARFGPELASASSHDGAD